MQPEKVDDLFSSSITEDKVLLQLTNLFKFLIPNNTINFSSYL